MGKDEKGQTMSNRRCTDVDRYITWTKHRDMFLGAHSMNDPNFKISSTVKNKSDSDESASDKSIIQPNCVIQPFLEVITARDIEINEGLLIGYNHN